MVETIINRNIIFLQKHGVKMETYDDKDLYKYGLRLIYSYITNVTIILSLSVIFSKFYESAIIISVFGLLQVFGGGYHAKTKIQCLLWMILGITIGNIMISVIVNYKAFIIISDILISVAIFILVPVPNKNHPVSKKIYKKSKYIARLLILLIVICILLLSVLNRDIETATMSIACGLYFISLFIVKIQK